MLEGINGNPSTAPAGEGPAGASTAKPPSGKPIGAPEAQPDVEVAISNAANARMEAMMAPAEHGSDTITINERNGGVDFGVEMGGFAWPLNSEQESTVANDEVSGEDGWEASREAGAGPDVAESSESAYLALGKTTVNANG
jgi:hypothetical protein